ncbi:hypothetical protein C8R46DRAFT_1058914 [Mycena filopes]|nr:hypothetical protein C8R46DRAFT_1058914 [Mycena filopes]
MSIHPHILFANDCQIPMLILSISQLVAIQTRSHEDLHLISASVGQAKYKTTQDFERAVEALRADTPAHHVPRRIRGVEHLRPRTDPRSQGAKSLTRHSPDASVEPLAKDQQLKRTPPCRLGTPNVSVLFLRSNWELFVKSSRAAEASTRYRTCPALLKGPRITEDGQSTRGSQATSIRGCCSCQTLTQLVHDRPLHFSGGDKGSISATSVREESTHQDGRRNGR